MVEALILIIIVAGIVVASRRWPDIEKRLFGDHGTIPHKETAEPHRTSPAAAPKPASDQPTTPSAGGFMQRREISAEPDVDPSVMSKEAPVEASKPEVKPEVTPAPEPTPEPVAEPAPVAPAPQAPTTPGAHVTGAPAVPSEPAYVNATTNITDNIDELIKVADKAYRERDYEKAEAACIKILMQQPKNHKYMTRIGQIYQEMGSLEDAKEAFEAAKELDPKNFFVLNRLAEVERQLSDKRGRGKSKA